MHLKLQGTPTPNRHQPVHLRVLACVHTNYTRELNGFMYTPAADICTILAKWSFVNNTSLPYCYIDLFFVCLALPNHPIPMSDYWDSWIPQGPRSSLWLFSRLWIDRICWYFRPCRWYRLPLPHQMVADQPRRRWISRCNKHFQLRCVKR